jgi:hypothetical protein
VSFQTFSALWSNPRRRFSWCRFLGRHFSRDEEGTIQIRIEAGCCGKAQGSNAGALPETDRALLLADAE